MSKPTLNRSCRRKRRMSSEEASAEAARHSDGLAPYECSFCGHFHVGHPGTRLRKRSAK